MVIETTDTNIREIAQGIMSASDHISAGRTTYLRTLLAATQAAIGKRGQDKPVQLAALGEVHQRFYAVVLEAAEAFVPRGTKDRAVALHSRANFARTSLSALRGHVRAGADLMALKPEKVTKTSLKVRAGPTRPPSIRRLTQRAEVASKRVVALLMGLADIDKAAGIAEMQLLLGQVTTQLVSLGVVSTGDAAVSIAEHRPLKVGKTLFIPTDTQVLRDRARPS